MTAIVFYQNKLYSDRLLKSLINDHALIDKKTNGSKMLVSESKLYAICFTGALPVFFHHQDWMDSAILPFVYENSSKKQFRESVNEDLKKNIAMIDSGTALLMFKRNNEKHSNNETLGLVKLNKNSDSDKVNISYLDPFFPYCFGSAAVLFQSGLDMGLKPESIFERINSYNGETSKDFDSASAKDLLMV